MPYTHCNVKYDLYKLDLYKIIHKDERGVKEASQCLGLDY